MKSYNELKMTIQEGIDEKEKDIVLKVYVMEDGTIAGADVIVGQRRERECVFTSVMVSEARAYFFKLIKEKLEL